MNMKTHVDLTDVGESYARSLLRQMGILSESEKIDRQASIIYICGWTIFTWGLLMILYSPKMYVTPNILIAGLCLILLGLCLIVLTLDRFFNKP
jgi:hypothetical protein